MALDREKTFIEAERQLRHGKVPQALALCRRLAEEAPRDLLMLNRVGDLLTRAGRTAEAVGYYDRIAEQFLSAGFLPRAIAILKKIVKLDPARTDALVRLGELYVKQRIVGEARTYFLHAADRLVKAHQYTNARRVYEKLAAAEPRDPLNRVRLAEARAAEGDSKAAVEDLLAAAATLERMGRHPEAERTYHRAAELLPDRPEPQVRLAASLGAQGRAPEALRLLEDLLRRRPGDPDLAGELLLQYERAGREEAVTRLLADPLAPTLSETVFENWLQARRGRESGGRPLDALEPVLRAWIESGRTDRAVTLLERLTRVEPAGWVPALERLYAVLRAAGDGEAADRALAGLVRACRALGHEAEAGRWAEELRGVAPGGSEAEVTRAEARVPTEVPAPAAEESERRTLPADALAPAVPLQRDDEEFLAGHMTEAEVFEKYGLIPEAVRQLRHATRRFPGHVGAQERLAELLRAQRDRAALAETLVDLALARRATGDEGGARAAAVEADRQGTLHAQRIELLRALSLLEPLGGLPVRRVPEPPARTVEAPPVAQAAREAPSAPPATAPQARVRVPAEGTPSAADGGEELDIVFEEELAAAATAGAHPEVSGRGRVGRTPDPEVLGEISFYIEQGMVGEALQKIRALRTLGYEAEALDVLEGQAHEASPRPQEEEVIAEGVSQGPAGGPPTDRLDEADLRNIAQMLDAELGALVDEPAASLAFDEQSVADVFAAFKEHVEREVGAEDHQTHYDLGIAYKEMGLLEDAIEEFRRASEAPRLRRQACSMLALCEREKGDMGEAARWYREALEAPHGPDDSVEGLRYELAEVLLASGDARGALDLFLAVLAADPAYREVRARVAEIRARLAT